MGQSHWVHCEKGPAEVVFPSPAVEVQPVTGAAETVLLYNCLVQLNYQIWPQKTTGGSPDCWVNHWYNPPHYPRNVLIQSEQKSWQNNSGTLTSSTLPLWTANIWSTLQSSQHQNDQAQKQFLPSGNPSHENLTVMWNTQHKTLLYIIYSSHILIYILNLHIIPTYIIVYIIYCIFCTLPILYICILFFLLCVSCPVAVFLLHCGASVTIIQFVAVK